MKSAIVVTSWYHTRRALACFANLGKGMQFSSFPTYDDLDMKNKPSLYETPHVFREYPGLLWYMIRYGISPRAPISGDSPPNSELQIRRI
jgi:uncharacterized SAM-binding protein YcdF (DUF218 family)